ncbi:MAG: hypothetical protein FIA96_08805 [Betaproteobacteria bacterium]|nr:hypothetical protein [Betaproteobacteria bacterium]
MSSLAARYRGYADLAAHQAEGTDYKIHVRKNAQSSIAVIAPHGGGIETCTSEIARAIAGGDLNLYQFEGIRPSKNYGSLHLTSHRFDEPRCLELLADCDHVVAIHGCSGEAQQALVGGLDAGLKVAMAQSIAALGIETLIADHPFPAVDPMNICNRGRRGVGVQIEMTMPLRRRGPRDALCAAIRSVLLALPEHPCREGSTQCS